MSVRAAQGSYWERVVLPRRRDARRLARAKRQEALQRVLEGDRFASLMRRLTWAHGPDAAARILMNRDAMARADELAWKGLGL